MEKFSKYMTEKKSVWWIHKDGDCETMASERGFANFEKRPGGWVDFPGRWTEEMTFEKFQKIFDEDPNWERKEVELMTPLKDVEEKQ